MLAFWNLFGILEFGIFSLVYLIIFLLFILNNLIFKYFINKKLFFINKWVIFSLVRLKTHYISLLTVEYIEIIYGITIEHFSVNFLL